MMMTTIDKSPITTLTINGNPIGKQRHRTSRGRTYTPIETLNYENKIAIMAKRAGLPKINKPIAIKIIAIHSRPKRLLRKKDPITRILKDTKPDLDNIIKVALDGLKHHFNDQQVQKINAEKYFCSINEDPKLEISIEELK